MFELYAGNGNMLAADNRGEAFPQFAITITAHAVIAAGIKSLRWRKLVEITGEGGSQFTAQQQAVTETDTVDVACLAAYLDEIDIGSDGRRTDTGFDEKTVALLRRIDVVEFFPLCREYRRNNRAVIVEVGDQIVVAFALVFEPGI